MPVLIIYAASHAGEYYSSSTYFRLSIFPWSRISLLRLWDIRAACLPCFQYAYLHLAELYLDHHPSHYQHEQSLRPIAHSRTPGLDAERLQAT